LASAKTRPLLNSDQQAMALTLSQDARWMLFQIQKSTEVRQIFIAPFRDGSAAPAAEWIPVTDGDNLDRCPFWSPDGNLVYFQSERDGFRCLYAQRLDPQTKHRVGPAFAAYHSHHSRLALSNLDDPAQVGPAIARDRLVFAQGEITGNIWMARPIQ